MYNDIVQNEASVSNSEISEYSESSESEEYRTVKSYDKRS
jgi:hypothetical protein